MRLNAFYEGTDTFRDFGHLERYGINPTVTLKPDDNTKIKLSYEYFHDERPPTAAIPRRRSFPETRRRPASIRRRRSHRTATYGRLLLQPDAQRRRSATVQTGMAIIEHDFENGLTVRNGTIAADYKKFYQNVYPANGTLLGRGQPR